MNRWITSMTHADAIAFVMSECGRLETSAFTPRYSYHFVSNCPEAVVPLCDYPLDFAAKESVHGTDERRPCRTATTHLPDLARALFLARTSPLWRGCGRAGDKPKEQRHGQTNRKAVQDPAKIPIH